MCTNRGCGGGTRLAKWTTTALRGAAAGSMGLCDELWPLLVAGKTGLEAFGPAKPGLLTPFAGVL